MESWFGPGTSGFNMFGSEHVFILILIVMVSVIMYVLRSRLMGKGGVKRILLAGLLLSEISYHLWAVYNNIWTMKFFLPLQLCSLNILLSIVLLLTDNRKLFAFVYLFGLTGAIQGLLTPELYQEPWHFRFLQYFIAHAFIVWTALYYGIVKTFKISWAQFFMSFLWLNVYALGVYLINTAIGANYLFLMKKPDNASLMDYLGPHPWYILALELVALCLCLLVFIPVKEKSHVTRKGHPLFKA
ncbi:TIGR02206 family membrane protein [Fictibacillus sp. b24]|uniref:YwaF family protein n=1 Tax=Fictibacillus sp. b24 TaxID=3055863 RepID=UPI0025A067BF|nr:TIGR02206 family membrane protein [Fictibacillus sp. b24]MDM5317823.1 TIGR02206 family membrane protein [Fictibacillus sp. b24]